MGFLALLVISFLVCIPAWYVARKRHSWYGWDYATVFAPIPIWLSLAIIQVGANSMSNLVELLILGAFVPLAVSARVFLLDRWWKNQLRNSLVILVICTVVLPLGLRLAMPALPE